MKKTILISLVVIVLLVVGAAAYVISNANSIVQKFKPELERIASEAIGADVKLGELSVSLFPTTAVNVSTFSLGATGETEGVKLKELVLNVDLSALLASELKITKLHLNQPSIVAIKDASGVHIPGMPKTKEAKKPSEPHAPANKKSDGASAPASTPLKVSLESFQLSDGSLVLKDSVAGKDYSVTKLNIESGLTVSGDTVTLPIANVSGVALENIPFAVRAEKLEVNGAQGTVTIPKISIDAMGSSADIQAKYLLTSGNADGKIDIKRAGHSLNGFTVTDLQGVIDFSMAQPNIKARSEKLTFNLNNQPIQASFDTLLDQTAQTLTVRPFKVGAFAGVTEGDFTLNIADAAKPFTTQVNISNLDADKALSVLPGGNAAKLTGILESLKAQLQGELGTDPKSTLKGTTALKFKDGKIHGVNVAGQVLRAVTSLPFLKSGLYSAVPDQSKGTVDADFTTVKSLTGTFNIGGSTLQTQNLYVISDLFALEGKGRVGFNAAMDVTATIYFEQQFSEGLAQRAKDLRTLFDQTNRLTIPLAISGTPPAVIVTPNLEKLLEVAGTRLLQQGATKLLEQGLKEKGLGNLFGF